MVRVQIEERGIRDLRVLDAMRQVPRHEFVAEAYRQDAYEDHPLPIGEEQTISQPYIVAAMLEYLALQAGDRVLEIGTGSGYVTALLSLLSAEVYSVERHAPLAASAESLRLSLYVTFGIALLGGMTMSSMPIDRPARVAYWKPSCLIPSSNRTVVSRPKRR